MSTVSAGDVRAMWVSNPALSPVNAPHVTTSTVAVGVPLKSCTRNEYAPTDHGLGWAADGKPVRSTQSFLPHAQTMSPSMVPVMPLSIAPSLGSNSILYEAATWQPRSRSSLALTI